VIKRTDGSRDICRAFEKLAYWCHHCEKFGPAENLKYARDLKEEEQDKATGSYSGILELTKDCMLGSKRYIELLEKYDTAKKKAPKRKFEWFSFLYFRDSIRLALKSEELSENFELLGKLRLGFWRDSNKFPDSESYRTKESCEIFDRLMKDWEGNIDIDYLFTAEMLRNRGKFKESMRLLSNPNKQFKPILEANPEWVRVMKTMNRLRLPQTVDIRIRKDLVRYEERQQKIGR
jgi:tetratricopeptide (TPR) repeat protein